MDDLRVFLSHTSDLAAAPDFVEAAIRTIASLPGLSVEEQTTTFTAEDLPPAEVCRRRLAGSDVYVGLVGYTHGTPVKDDPAGRSFVELEFDVARELGLPRIVLMLAAEPGRAMTLEQSAFRSRLEQSQEIVFASFTERGDLRLALERALAAFRPEVSEHVSCHVEWATGSELSGLGIDARAHRWAVYVRNASAYPAFQVLARVQSNTGGDDLEIDMGTIAARDLTGSPYVLNLEVADFDPEGDRPLVELSFTIAAVRWRRRVDGSLTRAARRQFPTVTRRRGRGV